MIHLVTLDFPPAYDGGVAAWAEDLGRALVDQGQPVRVYARRTGDTGAADRALPFEVARLRGRSWGRWQGIWAAAVAPRVRRGDTVVLATWPLGTVLAPLVAGRAAVAVAFHGSELTRHARAPAGLRRVVAVARACLPVSRFLQAELLRLTGREGVVMPMPLAFPASAPQGARQGLVCLARLTPLKGVERVLALGEALGWPVSIIGDGPARSSLEAQGAGAEVRFHGRLPRAEARRALGAHQLCALLPRTAPDGGGAEGLGLALLEAMGEGTPVVGCATGGVPEAVGEGLVLDAPDDAAASADQVRGWLAGGARGDEARRWVLAHHGPAASVGALMEALA
ncbi:MAG: glycosyltransferase family 4 protein [Alphaproteobacteria bacterium]|nr:glycosyltransferase family 4 protein [Alphaproteobacteria bacterium]